MTKAERRSEMTKTTEQYLKAPYARILIPESDGTYTAEILEFPGCLAQGDTAQEALANLEQAARGWIVAALEQGQEIPPPTTNQGFSGRLALRLPRSLHKQATRLAQRDGTSLNQFLVTAVAARVGAEDIFNKIVQTTWRPTFNWTRVNLTNYTTVISGSLTSGVVASALLAPSAYSETTPVLSPQSTQLVIPLSHGGTERA